MTIQLSGLLPLTVYLIRAHAEKRTVRACFQRQNEGRGLWHWLERVVRAGCPGKHKHPGESGEEKPNEEKAQKIWGKDVKRQIFLFSTLPRIGIQVYLEQK